MCGIAGIFNFDGRPVDLSELQNLTDRMAHRGPDGAGIKSLGAAGLGHRRLSIIDLGGGTQPMSNEDGSVWVTFNGEIYNYRNLREQLIAAGHRFATNSDTEVIVHAYEEWGGQCVQYLRGMFAFGIFDLRSQSLFLARDRLGIKPLVYWQTGDRICFASELQAFESLQTVPDSVDLESLDAYLQLAYIPAPRTIYRNVFKLPPGSTLTVDSDGIASLKRYWRLGFRPDSRLSNADWVDRLQETLADAVSSHLVADVEVGSLLSSGLDSTVVTALMTEQLQHSGISPRTYTIGFHATQADEATGAREVADFLKTEHHEEYVELQFGDEFSSLVRSCGEPFADSSLVPTMAVARSASRDVKVVLSGDGGDEAFVGYSWMLSTLRAFGVFGERPRLAAIGNVRRFMGNLGVWPTKTDPLRTVTEARSVFNAAQRKNLWKDSIVTAVTGRRQEWATYSEVSDADDLCSKLQALDYCSYLASDILFKVDIASMRHGLEVRVPLLDHQVVELAATIPPSFNVMSGGAATGNQLVGKAVLRQVAGRLIPKALLERPKRGFGLPLGDWASPDRSASICDLLHAEDSRLVEVFESSYLSWLVSSGNRSGHRSTQLWSLSVLAEWFRQHPDVSVSSE